MRRRTTPNGVQDVGSVATNSTKVEFVATLPSCSRKALGAFREWKETAIFRGGKINLAAAKKIVEGKQQLEAIDKAIAEQKSQQEYQQQIQAQQYRQQQNQNASRHIWVVNILTSHCKAFLEASFNLDEYKYPSS